MTQQFPLAWEAYVAGHHGPAFGAWLDAAWEEATLGLPPPGGRTARCPGFAEMNLALRRLAAARAVEAVALVDAQRAVDAIRHHAWRLLRAWRSADFDTLGRAYARGYRWVKVLGNRTAVLLVPDAGSESVGWLGLGTAVGRCRRACRYASATGVPEARLLNDVREVADRLRNASASAEVKRLLSLTAVELAAGCGPQLAASNPYFLYRALSEADRKTQDVLRGVPSRQPDLLLNAERLVFYGREAPLASVLRPQAAALWVLAENAGRPVKRETIRREGMIRTNDERVSQVISRLRSELAELLGTNRDEVRTFRKRLRRLIRGAKGRSPDWGPYILDITPELVHVSPPRPAWMRQA